MKMPTFKEKEGKKWKEKERIHSYKGVPICKTDQRNLTCRKENANQLSETNAVTEDSHESIFSRKNRTTSPFHTLSPTDRGPSNWPTNDFVIARTSDASPEVIKTIDYARDEDQEERKVCEMATCQAGKKLKREKLCKTEECPAILKKKVAADAKKAEKKSYCKKNPFALLGEAVLNAFADKETCRLSKAEKKYWKKMKYEKEERNEQFQNLDGVHCKSKKKSKETQCRPQSEVEETNEYNVIKMAKATSCNVPECPIVMKKQLIKEFIDKSQNYNANEKQEGLGYSSNSTAIEADSIGLTYCEDNDSYQHVATTVKTTEKCLNVHCKLKEKDEKCFNKYLDLELKEKYPRLNMSCQEINSLDEREGGGGGEYDEQRGEKKASYKRSSKEEVRGKSKIKKDGAKERRESNNEESGERKRCKDAGGKRRCEEVKGKQKIKEENVEEKKETRKEEVEDERKNAEGKKETRKEEAEEAKTKERKSIVEEATVNERGSADEIVEKNEKTSIVNEREVEEREVVGEGGGTEEAEKIETVEDERVERSEEEEKEKVETIQQGNVEQITTEEIKKEEIEKIAGTEEENDEKAVEDIKEKRGNKNSSIDTKEAKDAEDANIVAHIRVESSAVNPFSTVIMNERVYFAGANVRDDSIKLQNKKQLAHSLLGPIIDLEMKSNCSKSSLSKKREKELSSIIHEAEKPNKMANLNPYYLNISTDTEYVQPLSKVARSTFQNEKHDWQPSMYHLSKKVNSAKESHAKNEPEAIEKNVPGKSFLNRIKSSFSQERESKMKQEEKENLPKKFSPKKVAKSTQKTSRKMNDTIQESVVPKRVSLKDHGLLDGKDVPCGIHAQTVTPSALNPRDKSEIGVGSDRVTGASNLTFRNATM